MPAKRTKEMTAGWLKKNLAKQRNPTYSTRCGLGKAKENLEEQVEESDRLWWEHDDQEQYSRKNSLEINGIPQDAYSDTEAALIDRAWRYRDFSQNIEGKSHYSEILQPQGEV